MAYPSVVSSFTNPNASDSLNSPSHSSIETSQNTDLTAIETFVGTLSSTQGTLMYDVRAAASGGGGHVQTAVLGGTGQTTYTKGDILAGVNSSTLSKLAIGTNNQVLVADDTQASGVKWGSPNRIGTNASVVTVLGNTSETSILSVTVPASILSSANAVKGEAFISAYTVGGASDTLLIKANYGANQVASILLSPSGASTSSVKGKINFTLMANAASNAQRGELSVVANVNRVNILQNSVLGISAYEVGTSSINSNVNQTFGLTAQWGASIAGSRIDIDGYTVEKIT